MNKHNRTFEAAFGYPSPSTTFYACLVFQIMSAAGSDLNTVNLQPTIAGVFIASLGMMLMLISKQHFENSGVDVDPGTQPQKLVIDGPYRYCRHPFYFGSLILLSATGCLLSGWVGLIIAVAYWIYLDSYTKSVEEPNLHRAFDKKHKMYTECTGKWLPNLKSLHLCSKSISQR